MTSKADMDGSIIDARSCLGHPCLQIQIVDTIGQGKNHGCITHQLIGTKLFLYSTDCLIGVACLLCIYAKLSVRLNLFLRHQLAVIQLCHLAVYLRQCPVVAVGTEGISLLCGIEIPLQRHRSLMPCKVDSTHQVVCQHPLIRIPMTVIVVHHLLEHRI